MGVSPLENCFDPAYTIPAKRIDCHLSKDRVVDIKKRCAGQMIASTPLKTGKKLPVRGGPRKAISGILSGGVFCRSRRMPFKTIRSEQL
jgi:hypothetical protein